MDQASVRALIVDDEPALLKMMAAYLGRLGYAVSAVNSTDQAWSKVEAAPAGFDVAVLDRSMTGLSTEELALRMLKGNPALRLIAASGYPVDMKPLEAAAPGRVTFLQKPFTPEELAGTIRRMLGAPEEAL